ncbi:MAG: hypothetical protein KME47_09640 [Nodosilinea sp. WJT8-NPBG4]|jgi:hypothetical protein|nr:hypothetical protein [Nodosilinea sp. WJT8-NPBG4]
MTYTTVKQDIVIQDPEADSPGLVELTFRLHASYVDSDNERCWYDSDVVRHMVEVDTLKPVEPQVSFIADYLSETYKADYLGHCACFSAVDENPDWF